MRLFAAIRSLAASLLLLAATLLLLELAARWFVAEPERLARLHCGGCDRYWRLAWITRHGEGGAGSLGFDRYDAELGWTLQANLAPQAVFGARKLSSNSQGLRGQREPSIPKPEGLRRILVFGDSFAFGEEVGDGDTFSAQLEASLERTEVLNFGVRGYGHDQMLLRLRREAQRYQPDLIVLAYVTDDSRRNLLRFRSFAKPRFRLDDSGAIRLEGVPVPSPEQVAAGAWRESRLFNMAALLLQQAAWRSPQMQTDIYALTRGILQEFFAESKAMGASVLLLDLPTLRELHNLDPRPTEREQTLAELARDADVPYLNLRPALIEAARAGVPLSTAAHWGPAEHRYAAAEIARFLAGGSVLQR